VTYKIVTQNNIYLEQELKRKFYTGLGLGIAITTLVLSPFILVKEAPTQEANSDLMQVEEQVEDKQTWVGKASYYSWDGCVGCDPNRIMANGEVLDDNAYTVAFNELPLGTYVMVRNLANGQFVTAQVTDTGGFDKLDRIIDLTIAVKNAIGCGDLCDVEVKEL